VVNIGFPFPLQTCGPQTRLCLFMFSPVALKQLNNSITIDTLSWLGGAETTHPLWMQDAMGSIPGSGKGFYVWLFYFVVVFLFLPQNTLFGFCSWFCNFYFFSILNILQALWPIIRVYWHRPSIFKPKASNNMTFKINHPRTFFHFCICQFWTLFYS